MEVLYKKVKLNIETQVTNIDSISKTPILVRKGLFF